jgi:hypothetical protein
MYLFENQFYYHLIIVEGPSLGSQSFLRHKKSGLLRFAGDEKI